MLYMQFESHTNECDESRTDERAVLSNLKTGL